MLLANHRTGAIVIEMAVGRIGLIVIEERVQRKIIDKGKVTRLRVPEMAAGVIVEVDPGVGREDVFVTEIVLINQRIGLRGVIAKPGAVVQVSTSVNTAKG